MPTSKRVKKGRTIKGWAVVGKRGTVMVEGQDIHFVLGPVRAGIEGRAKEANYRGWNATVKPVLIQIEE